jgi:hypothetical protein
MRATGRSNSQEDNAEGEKRAATPGPAHLSHPGTPKACGSAAPARASAAAAG